VRRVLRTFVAATVAGLALAGTARAAGGDYVFDGGTTRQRQEVRSALEASAFPWSAVPARITIHVAPGTGSYSLPGHVYVDGNLLDAGRFSWAVVQDEYAHQVDFFRFDAAVRTRLTLELGARDWCYGAPGLAHSEYGCERFASTLVWAYWPSADNAYRPTSSRDESAAMAPARFRALMAELLGVPAAIAPAGRTTRPTRR
jgi:hypothetical protein